MLIGTFKVEKISIHAPRVGGDVGRGHAVKGLAEFQSTPPVWGATAELISMPFKFSISIHAPRVGGDGPIESH